MVTWWHNGTEKLHVIFGVPFLNDTMRSSLILLLLITQDKPTLAGHVSECFEDPDVVREAFEEQFRLQKEMEEMWNTHNLPTNRSPAYCGYIFDSSFDYNNDCAY
ncbi:unnamed protein product, partial [Urochloa humidicola]